MPPNSSTNPTRTEINTKYDSLDKNQEIARGVLCSTPHIAAWHDAAMWEVLH